MNEKYVSLHSVAGKICEARADVLLVFQALENYVNYLIES